MKQFVYPNPVIAERIQQVMRSNALTDKAVAEHLDRERKAICNYRNCVTNPDIKIIRYLCANYHVDANWLLDLKCNAVLEERKRIIKLIEKHQEECDSLDIIATAEWVKQELEGSDEEDS